MSKLLAVYPGSFDPPTLGHLDIVERAARLFDELVIAVGVNSSKKPMLTVEQRREALRLSTEHLPNVRVDSFSGLLIDYAASLNAHAVVRGLRATLDFEYEFQMALVNRRMNENIESVYFMTTWEHNYLSSSIVREVASLGGDISTMVHPEVEKIIRASLGERF